MLIQRRTLLGFHSIKLAWWAQLSGCKVLLQHVCITPWVQSLLLHKLGVAGHTCILVQEVETGKSEVQNHPQFITRLSGSLGHMCFKTTTTTTKNIEKCHMVYMS